MCCAFIYRVFYVGKHFWGAFSNGTDLYADKYESVTPPAYDVTHIPGSNETYCFRSTGTADENSTTVAHKFMQCYCECCRKKKFSLCPDREEFGAWHTTIIHKKTSATRRRTRESTADTLCSDCADTGDEE